MRRFILGLLALPLFSSDALLTEASRILALRKTGSYSHTTSVDENTGDVNIDCSGLVDYCLGNIAPVEYLAIPRNGHTRPLASDFNAYFRNLSPSVTKPFKRIYQVQYLQPGDIIAWTQGPSTRHPEDTGHVMIVKTAPTVSPCRKNEYYVRVVDSTASYHYDDAREQMTSSDGVHTSPGQYVGVGEGTISLVVDEHYEPISYYWNGPGSTHESTTHVRLGRFTAYGSAADGFDQWGTVGLYIHARYKSTDATLNGTTLTALKNHANPGTNDPGVVGSPQWDSSGWASGLSTYDFTGTTNDKLTSDALASTFNGDDTGITILMAINMTEATSAYLYRLYGSTAYYRVRLSSSDATKLVSARHADSGSEVNSTSGASLPTGNMILGVSFGNNGSAIQHLVKAYSASAGFRTTYTIDVGSSTFTGWDWFANATANYLTNKCRALVVINQRLTETNLELAMQHLEKDLDCGL